MKFCGFCGIFGRGDKLKLQHIKGCQPGLDKDESGFLKNGQVPELDVENFRAMLRIMGACEKPPKPALIAETTEQPEDTVSESVNNISSRSSKDEQDQERPSSQVSFCQKSHISSNSNFQTPGSLFQPMETPGNDAGDDRDAEEGHLDTTQENIQDLFDRVKRHALAVKAAAKKKRLADFRPPNINGQNITDEIEQIHPQTPSKSEKSFPRTDDDALLPSTAYTNDDALSSGKKRPIAQTNMPPRNLFNGDANKRVCTDDISSGSPKNSRADNANPMSINASPRIEVTEDDISFIKNKYDQASNVSNNITGGGAHLRTVSEHLISHFGDTFLTHLPDPIQVWTQTSSYQVQAARLAERFEAELLRYPKLRCHHLKNDIKKGQLREEAME